MRIKIVIDTDDITDLLALKGLIEHYLSQPAQSYTPASSSYGGIDPAPNPMWKNYTVEKVKVMNADGTRFNATEDWDRYR